jgi:hypothetical protein
MRLLLDDNRRSMICSRGPSGWEKELWVAADARC